MTLQEKLDWFDAQKQDGVRVWYLNGRWRWDRNDPGYDTLEDAVDRRIQDLRRIAQVRLNELRDTLAREEQNLAALPPASEPEASPQ